VAVSPISRTAAGHGKNVISVGFFRKIHGLTAPTAVVRSTCTFSSEVGPTVDDGSNRRLSHGCRGFGAFDQLAAVGS